MQFQEPGKQRRFRFSIYRMRLILLPPHPLSSSLPPSLLLPHKEYGKLVYPATFRIASVRVYQKGDANVGCDPRKYREFYLSQSPLFLYSCLPHLPFFYSYIRLHQLAHESLHEQQLDDVLSIRVYETTKLSRRGRLQLTPSLSLCCIYLL